MRSSETSRRATGPKLRAARLAFLTAAFGGFSAPATASGGEIVALRAADGAIVLDGRAAATDSGGITFAWALIDRPAGSEAVLEAASSAVPTLRPDVEGAYAIELVTVRDGVADAPLRIELRSDNLAPVIRADASAPPAVGVPVLLSAERSFDPDGDRLGFDWQIVSAPEGSVAAIARPTAPRPTFVPDVEGDYTIALSATDSYGLTTRREMSLASLAAGVTAEAGPDRSAAVGEAVALDPFGSTSAEGTALTAAWTILSAPEGSAATIADGAAIKPPLAGRSVLMPDTEGDYLLGLAVTDGTSTSHDTVTIAVGAMANVAPVAEAGRDRMIEAGASALLDASGSTDADGDALTYAWSLVATPEDSFAAVVPTLDGGPFATLLTDVPGDYVAQVTVDDGARVAVDTVTISTEAVAPVVTGLDDGVLPSERIASLGFAGPDGADAYRWSVLELGTPGASLLARFSDDAAASTTLDFKPRSGRAAERGGRARSPRARRVRARACEGAGRGSRSRWRSVRRTSLDELRRRARRLTL